MSKIKVASYLAIILAIILAMVFAPYYAPLYYISILIYIFMYAILAISWSMMAGTTNYISLGTAAFFGIGAYLVPIFGFAFTEPMLTYPILILVGYTVSFMVAFALGFVVLRLRGVYFAIATFGLAELARHLLMYYEITITGTVGRFVFPPFTENTPVYHALFTITMLSLITSWRIRNSKFGMALLSIGGGEEKAQTLGVNTTVYKVLMFAVSSGFMGAAGAAIVPRWLYIDPGIVFNSLYSFNPAVMALLGGIGTIFGPFLGAALLGVSSEMLTTLFPHYYLIGLGALVILVVFFMPSGIMGLIGKSRRLMKFKDGIRKRFSRTGVSGSRAGARTQVQKTNIIHSWERVATT